MRRGCSITVSSSGLQLGVSEMTQPVSILEGDALVRRREATLGGTLEGEGVTVSPLVVDTEVSKSITPEQVFGVPGTDALVTLTSKVT